LVNFAKKTSSLCLNSSILYLSSINFSNKASVFLSIMLENASPLVSIASEISCSLASSAAS
jgi:hypothetical protein